MTPAEIMKSMHSHAASASASAAMLDLRCAHGEVIQVIGPGVSIALLDEPVHRNIGDYLIQRGTERFFSQLGTPIIARAHVYSYNRRTLARRLRPDTALVCAGGGHLGDLYPSHQRLREQLVADFPDRRIVILPQSLYFRSADAEAQMTRAFAAHADLHVFLRDQDSLQRAERLGLSNLHLAPDMAHALYPIVIKWQTQNGALHLLRRDKEAIDATITGDAIDWPDLVRATDTLTLGLLAAAFQLSRALGSPAAADNWLFTRLDRQRSVLLRRAIALFSSYDRIVSSRLHGALLGLLMDKQVRLMPSRTGKSGAYYRTWLTGMQQCSFAEP
jgi:pyruvyl transferase EpsO